MMSIQKLPTMKAPSGRFVLRPFREGDASALVKHINSSHISDRVSNVPHPYTKEHAEKWLRRLEEERTKFHYARRIDFAIDVKGEVVGSIGFINIDGHKAQISYWLGEEFQGKGFMPEALRLLVDFGFSTCGFTRMWGYTWENNPASQHVFEKVGFAREGIHKKEWLKNGVYHDSVMYAIVR
ncbi:MAG: GNAT family protein [bacterium]|nr:GNAT family protein [bacterium]